MGAFRVRRPPPGLPLALHLGLLAANSPLTEDDIGTHRLPEKLVPHRDKLFGLTIDPVRLQQIRKERRPNSNYASVEQCRHEVQTVEALYRRERIPFLDTSTVSIEEIATTILQKTNLQRRI